MAKKKKVIKKKTAKKKAKRKVTSKKRVDVRDDELVDMFKKEDDFDPSEDILSKSADKTLSKKLKDIQRANILKPRDYTKLLRALFNLTRKEIENLVEDDNTPMFVIAGIHLVREYVKHHNMDVIEYGNLCLFGAPQLIDGFTEEDQKELLPPVTIYELPSTQHDTLNAEFEKLNQGEDDE